MADRNRHHRNLEGCQMVAGASEQSEDLRSDSDGISTPMRGARTSIHGEASEQDGHKQQDTANRRRAKGTKEQLPSERIFTTK